MIIFGICVPPCLFRTHTVQFSVVSQFYTGVN